MTARSPRWYCDKVNHKRTSAWVFSTSTKFRGNSKYVSPIQEGVSSKAGTKVNVLQNDQAENLNDVS